MKRSFRYTQELKHFQTGHGLLMNFSRVKYSKHDSDELAEQEKSASCFISSNVKVALFKDLGKIVTQYVHPQSVKCATDSRISHGHP